MQSMDRTLSFVISPSNKQAYEHVQSDVKKPPDLPEAEAKSSGEASTR